MSCLLCTTYYFFQGIPLPWQTKRTVFRDRPFPIIVVNKSTRRVPLYINLIGINVIIIIIIIIIIYFSFTDLQLNLLSFLRVAVKLKEKVNVSGIVLQVRNLLQVTNKLISNLMILIKCTQMLRKILYFEEKRQK